MSSLLGIFPLLKARPCGAHIKLLFCPPPVMLERIFLNQNQMSCLPSSEKNQCKLIAKPGSLSLTFPRTRTFIYLLLIHSSAVQTINTSKQANKPAINIQELSNGQDQVILTVIRERNERKWYLTHEQSAEQKNRAILRNSKVGGKTG